MKKITTFSLLLLCVLVFPGCFLGKKCPEEWIINKMPQIEDEIDISGDLDLPEEYFIFGNEIKDVAEVDTEWVKTNCKIEPSEVY